MYYEERWVMGLLYHRASPDAPLREVTPRELVKMVVELRAELAKGNMREKESMEVKS